MYYVAKMSCAEHHVDLSTLEPSGMHTHSFSMHTRSNIIQTIVWFLNLYFLAFISTVQSKMGSPGGMAYRSVVNPPEKGSFPLDHFLECQETVDKYKACMEENKNMSAKCHHLARDYLQCRMDKGLMAKEDLDTLGFAKKPVPPDEEVVSQLGQYKPRKEEYIAGLGKVRRN